MTDKTQPEALRLVEQYDYGDPATYGNVWKTTVCTELRRQHARIAELEQEVAHTDSLLGKANALARIRAHRIAELEAQLEAIGAGGVQALSAAPAVDIAKAGEMQAFEAWYKQDCVVEGAAAKIAAKAAWKARAMLAASPPAEQQAAPKAAPGEPGYREKWDAELGRTAMRFVDRAGDVHPGIDDAETICAEFHRAMSEVIERMPHVHRMTAPQQEAQEPWGYARKSPGCGWYLCSKRHHEEAVADGCETKKLYAAPQPAPAPLSEDALKKAARYDFLRDCDLDEMAAKYWPGGEVPTGQTFDAAIDAAIAAQGGKE